MIDKVLEAYIVFKEWCAVEGYEPNQREWDVLVKELEKVKE